jgi:TRAP-type transport system small permease protein
MSKLINALYRFLQVLLTLLMAALVVPVAMQVLSRYTPFVPRYIWTEEIARFCFVWVIMIGAMIAVREGTHFDVDVLPKIESPRAQGLLRLFVHFAIAVFAVSFVWWGWSFAELGARQISEIAGLPMLSIYIAWPLSGIVWLLFLAEHVWKDLRMLASGEEP